MGALLLSLLAHVAFFALPAGQGLAAGGSGMLRPVSLQRAAPLTVRLGPLSPRTVQGRSDSSWQTRLPLPQSPMLDSEGLAPAPAPRPGPPGEAAGPKEIPAPRPGLEYYGMEEITQAPKLRMDIDTQMADDQTGAGQAVLVLYISEKGEVDRVEAETSTLESGLQKLVNERFAELRFIPAQRRGEAVKSRLRIEITIEPRSPAP